MLFNRIKRIFAVVIACLSINSVFSAEMEFGGMFFEQNMYIKNPSMESGFCIKSISVNGKSANANLNTGLVVVRFSELGLKSGDLFNMVINYDENAKPVIINKGAFVTKSTFVLVSAKIEQEGNDSKLYFTIKDESSAMPFYIDHFRANKWVRIGAVIGKGGMEEKTYSLPIAGLPGENKIKIYQRNEDDTQWSFDVTVESPKKEVVELEKIVQKKNVKEIRFTGVTEYIIVDKAYGNIKLRGIGNKADISSLPKGKYFVTYEEKFKKFKRKKK